MHIKKVTTLKLSRKDKGKEGKVIATEPKKTASLWKVLTLLKHQNQLN